jgi:DNA-binding NtrC family response regulator
MKDHESRHVRIFILEDNPSERKMFKEMTEDVFKHRYNTAWKLDVTAVGDVDEFLLRFAELSPRDRVDLAIVDEQMDDWEQVGDRWVSKGKKPKQGGVVVERFARHPAIGKMVVLTADPDKKISEAGEISLGAFEFWLKQELGSFPQLREQLELIFELPSRYDLYRFKDEFDCPDSGNLNSTEALEKIERELVANHPTMLKVKAQVCEAALSGFTFGETEFPPVPVLITGETGTGKEIVAQLIHYCSPRGKPRGSTECVALNCGEFLEDGLLRSELFGHVKGSFTGAENDKLGIIRKADRGTLFLDEVALAPPRMQGLLLRAFEERKARPVGSIETYKFNVRLIAATDQDVFGSEQFSKAFLHRLSGIHIHLPPLCERCSDIRLLVDHFMTDKPHAPRISVAAWQVLEGYNWPGNVRQLKYVVDLLAEHSRRSQQKKVITRSDVERFLPQMGLRVEDRPAPHPDFDRYVGGGVDYNEVKARLLADYVHHQHERISGGERTNEAYTTTAAMLNCSVSTVKERLRDYARFFSEEGSHAVDD